MEKNMIDIFFSVLQKLESANIPYMVVGSVASMEQSFVSPKSFASGLRILPSLAAEFIEQMRICVFSAFDTSLTFIGPGTSQFQTMTDQCVE